MTTLLVPCDPLTPSRPDEHFAPEAEAAKAAGWNVVRMDHDALMQGSASTLFRAQNLEPGDGIYRGWMVPGRRYAALWLSMSERGIRLPTEYDKAHELPGWYWSFCNLTPHSVWTQGDSIDRFVHLCETFGSGPAVLRDYTKSEKHYWNDACYIPDVADIEAATDVALKFQFLRDESFTGGYVLRRFESFVGAEARLWCRRGRVVLTTAHPDTPDEIPNPRNADGFLRSIESSLTDAGLDFVTIDVARRDDGQWRVVEVGDGQVSDRPSSCDPHEFIAAIT